MPSATLQVNSEHHSAQCTVHNAQCPPAAPCIDLATPPSLTTEAQLVFALALLFLNMFTILSGHPQILPLAYNQPVLHLLILMTQQQNDGIHTVAGRDEHVLHCCGKI